MNDIDRQSKERAFQLFDDHELANFEVGTFRGLQQIHHYLFKGLCDFAGQMRTVDMSKGGFRFASHLYLPQALAEIDRMPESTFEEVITKYVEINVAHPFRDGNGRAARIWIDMILRQNFSQCVDWAKVSKVDYLSAMERSPINDLEIRELLRQALTDKINDREVFMKGIEQSYYYEEPGV